ncbi:hypothetical protein [Nostoc sp. GT001]|uniref:hypothetical protein n=1 Tax=Nostoc sp. GT001 TaxID=3056647 RepID=UPI0025AA51D9|nr:hypothetical protein [Nostoc sp. GT001]MDM9582077.1 hypothetical protein [Nostoc sp. GT001]
MNFINILLNTTLAAPESTNWPDVVQAMTSIIQAIAALPVVATVFDLIDEKIKGNVAKITPIRVLKKVQCLLEKLQISFLIKLLFFVPNSQIIQDALENICGRNKQLQNKIRELQILYKTRKLAAQWLDNDIKREKLVNTVCNSTFFDSNKIQELEIQEQLHDDIKDFLELIHNCLYDYGRYKSLSAYIDQLDTPLFVPPLLYIKVFDAIRKQARKELGTEPTKEIERYLKYLEYKFRTRYL